MDTSPLIASMHQAVAGVLKEFVTGNIIVEGRISADKLRKPRSDLSSSYDSTFITFTFV
jgi:hypothetical protein